MAAHPIILNMDQETRIMAALRDKYGEEDERSDNELIIYDIENYMGSFVENYEKRELIKNLNISVF